MGSAVVPVAQEVPEHMLVLVIQKLPFTQNQATQHRAMLQLTDQVIQNRVTDQLMHQDILNPAMLYLVTLLLKLQVMPQDILNLATLNLVTLRDTLRSCSRQRIGASNVWTRRTSSSWITKSPPRATSSGPAKSNEHDAKSNATRC